MLFSFLLAQHEQIVNWLTTLPYVDPARIGFYGLGYGGETAVRIPRTCALMRSTARSGNRDVKDRPYSTERPHQVSTNCQYLDCLHALES